MRQEVKERFNKRLINNDMAELYTKSSTQTEPIILNSKLNIFSESQQEELKEKLYNNYLDTYHDNYSTLQEPITETDPGYIHASISFDGKLSTVLFFTIGMFALYVILKKQK